MSYDNNINKLKYKSILYKIYAIIKSKNNKKYYIKYKNYKKAR